MYFVRRWILLGMLFAPCLGSAWALKIRIDYSLDTSNFFKTEGSPQRKAMRAVADYFEGLLTDKLSEINPRTYGGDVSWTGRTFHPATGDTHLIGDLVVPADTLVVFVGARPLGEFVLGRAGPGTAIPRKGDAAWRTLVTTRGETNPDGSPAVGPSASDFGPWGGSIVFNSDRRWNLSLSMRRFDGLWGVDFVSIALHEMCHVLGIGTSAPWDGYIQTNASGDPVFVGPHSIAEFGEVVPMEPEVLGHWQDPFFCQQGRNFDPDNPRNVLSKTIKQFGDPGNRDQIAIMNPSICNAGGVLFRVMTRLDVAGLRDVGWTIKGAEVPRVTVSDFVVDPVANGREISWEGKVGHFYQLEVSTGLLGRRDWKPIGKLLRGLGERLSVMDDTSDPNQFYRLVVEQR